MKPIVRSGDGDPLRVLHLVTSDAFAGTERHVLNLTRELRALGCAAELACPPSAVRLRSEATAAGVTLHPSRNCRPRAWLGAVARGVAVDAPNVIHAHDGKAAIVATALSKLMDGMLIRTQHFSRPASLERGGLRGSASLRFHRSLNRKLDGYIAVSQHVADGARERCETGTAKLVVIPPGIDLPTEMVVGQARTARREMSHPVVAFVGRLEPERRLDVLLRAVPLVRARFPDCQFVLAGSGGGEGELKLLASDLGIEDAIIWKGWVENSYSTLNLASVYVNPWPWEGFGMAMAEAMAIALPVVAIDTGASTNMVEPGINGWLVPGGDAEALAAAIIRLASDAACAAHMGEAARRRATSLYGAERTAQETLALYEELRERACA